MKHSIVKPLAGIKQGRLPTFEQLSGASCGVQLTSVSWLPSLRV